MRYDLVDLRVFLAVLDEGNLSRGAQRCNLAPSSVSQRIRQLEDTLGTVLLERNREGVSPTPAGTVLADYARKSFELLEQMHADMLPFSAGMPGRITLFANTNAINSFVPDDLAIFFKHHPSVRIALEEKNSHDILAAVADRRADVGIVALQANHKELTFFPYRDDDLVVLVPLSSPINRGRPVRFEECLREPFVELQRGAAINTFLLSHAAALGATLDIRVQVPGYRAVVHLVASGAGVSVVPRSAVEKEDEKRLAVLPLAEPWAQRNLRICVRQDAPANHHRDELVRILVECAAAAATPA
ncbi:LysR family transcriptional regulator [Bradyrhizobium sp. C-145]|uniref:LysR family transcriptional regulator n=1 Tax=Bradyrhizobium sp. C-145 TaxID=574727 RepID=UPI00201B791B|nr:LysR family transcriptional regulator [Bradyrhizobium sp. C-145]UQR61834.1 LysR family transcriptional regulator [Bradyrhizobium sp. C-145]